MRPLNYLWQWIEVPCHALPVSEAARPLEVLKGRSCEWRATCATHLQLLLPTARSARITRIRSRLSSQHEFLLDTRMAVVAQHPDKQRWMPSTISVIVQRWQNHIEWRRITLNLYSNLCELVLSESDCIASAISLPSLPSLLAWHFVTMSVVHMAR